MFLLFLCQNLTTVFSTMTRNILLQEVDKSCVVTLQQYMDIQKRNILQYPTWGTRVKNNKIITIDILIRNNDVQVWLISFNLERRNSVHILSPLLMNTTDTLASPSTFKDTRKKQPTSDMLSRE